MSKNQVIVALGVIAVVVLAVIIVPGLMKPKNESPVKPKKDTTKVTPDRRQQSLLSNVPTEPKNFLIWAARAQSTELNIQAIQALSRLEVPWGEKLIEEALARDEDGDLEDIELAAAAVYEKARRGTPDLIPVIRALLVESEEDWDADPWLARALGEIPGPAAVDVLAAMINKEDPDEDISMAVIRVLATREGPVAADAIKGQLDSDDEDVQATAAAALLRFGDEDARLLVEAFFEDPDESDWDEDVFTDALGTKGNEVAVPYLVRMSGAEIWDTRQIAARALGRTRVPEAKNALRDLLADEDEDVRVTAASVLATEFGDFTGIDTLVKAVRESKDPELALEALHGVIAANREEDRPIYEEIMKREAKHEEELLLKLWAAYALLRK
jgi:HEAT repeat protein